MSDVMHMALVHPGLLNGRSGHDTRSDEDEVEGRDTPKDLGGHNVRRRSSDDR